MGLCKDCDSELIKGMIAFGAIEEIKPELAPDQMGAAVVACADGEHMGDKFIHLHNTWPGRKRLHWLALNGGPALIPEESPVALRGERHILLGHLDDGRKLKEVKTNILIGHWPCGAAELANLSLVEYLRLCLQAKLDVQQHFDDGSETLLFLHVAYNGEKKRTYRVNRQALATHLDNLDRLEQIAV